MPVTRTELNHREILMACAHWVQDGCPEIPNAKVYIHITPGSDDPREPSGPTATASVEAT